jgi:ComF family protein
MLDLIYPRTCIHCGSQVVPDPLRYICWDCLCDTPKIEPPFCAVCGDPVAGDIQHNYTCFSCTREPPDFDYARSAVRYEGAVAEALRDLKYKGALWLVQDLSALLLACVQAEFPDCSFDAVTAVPLYPVRYRERGFNQSGALGAALARRMHIPFRAGFLRRIRSTVTQTGLTAPQRMANVYGAFRIGLLSCLSGRRILLVDDVMTTGATVNACAKALKKGGAAAVHVVTVARG